MDEFDPTPGVVADLGDGIRRILAPNPSPMTFRGTNTYLVGATDVAVIDPGPADENHLSAILTALAPDQRITHIFVTHSHLDHSPLSPVLARETGAKVHAFGPSRAGRSAVMQGLAAAGLTDAGEGVDPDFAPDVVLEDGAQMEGPDWSLTALWTPGHLGNHLCFAMGDVIFSGDLVMGWASSLVAPPDGDLTDFMASCRRLRQMNARVLHAGHGAPITDPAARIDWLIAHRNEREAAILTALSTAPATAEALTRQIYTDTPQALLPAAERNVLAHLIDLHGKNTVHPVGELTRDAIFALT
ncbi:MBL fold metallo-hydrolase [Roseovarius rhodophyticola]|uniref:MBL fold metallo-hydrolase n=1 Tax=Roseovarius rhodophyticola TaxID=3080827 RepID=A0ABZ2TEM6_9RHOB|nr:MBL fold metallo-hydrolase [Roseovarius sp. W115]MDV2928347.1 MBL fold metallo-hydrolase [Roseovarius sp. W115]